MYAGMEFNDIVAQVRDRQARKYDIVAKSGDMSYDAQSNIMMAGEHAIKLTTHAHTQLASFLGVDRNYYMKLLDAAADKSMREADRVAVRDLLGANVNHWLKSAAKLDNGAEMRSRVRMLRTYSTQTPTMHGRAIVSNSFLRLDHEHILGALAPYAHDLGLSVLTCNVSPSRLYLKAASPRLKVEVKKGDVVQFGVSIANSEIGLGHCSATPFIYRLVCTNGLAIQESLGGGSRTRHAGRRLQADGPAYVSSVNTQMKEIEARISRAKDAIDAALNPKNVEKMSEILRASTEGPQILRPLPAALELSSMLGLTKPEGEAMAVNLIQDGDFSRWGALNAVTKMAHNVDVVSDYDRSSEIEAIGARVLTLSQSEWRRVAEAEDAPRARRRA